MIPDIKIIENIKKNIEENTLNNSVAIDDPVLTDEEVDNLIDKYYRLKKNKVKYKIDKKASEILIEQFTKDIVNNIEFDGIENIKDIKNGAIITGNHYSPMDTLPVKKLIKKVFNKEIYIVSLASNLALKAPLDFIVNHENIIPLKNSVEYLTTKFKPELFDKLKQDELVLIYPEENMWNNYKKPRPCKRGAYQFAAEANVPVISLFTELKEENGIIKYIVHVLKPIYPNKEISIRQNSINMAKIDYEQKIDCYEKVFNKKLDYTFSYEDIAGYKKED